MESAVERICAEAGIGMAPRTAHTITDIGSPLGVIA